MAGLGSTSGPSLPRSRSRLPEPVLVKIEHSSALHALYAAFNDRDLDALLPALHADVDWPNAWEGGRLHGREAVRDYWVRQWRSIDPRVDPAAVTRRVDGRVAVEVDQIVRDLAGTLVAEARVVHVFEFRDGLVVRMDVEETAGSG